LEKLLAILSPIQRQFLLDSKRLKVARCTRRAGKSFVDAAYMIYECLLNPRTPVLYAGLTRDSAREAIWDILITMLDELEIPYDAKPSALMILFPNDSKITIFGCDAQNARNRLRGRKFKLVIFDETGFFAALDPLVYAVIPMLADYAGTLCLTSSPGELLQGLFYEADQGKLKHNWSRYFWSIHDNPLFQKLANDPRYKTRAEEELAIVLETQFLGDAKHPGYRREWLGEWVADNTSLVYPITPANLLDDGAPFPHQMHVLGIELGSSFNHALVVGRFSEYRREFQIIDQWTRADLSLDQFAKLLADAVEKYQPTMMLAHVGEFSDDVVTELRRRYQLPITAAKTKDKSFHQRVFSQDLQNGYIKVKAGLPILNEFEKIVKDDKGNEISGQENYAANAALVAYSKAYQTVLSTFEVPLSEEDRHIHQLEQGRFEEVVPWYDS
jgi:hypothetical protein